VPAAIDGMSSRSQSSRSARGATNSDGSAVEARNISAVAGLVAAGLGVSAVPGLVLPLVRFAGLEHRPLGDPRAERRIALVSVPHRPVSPAALAFRAAITDARHSGSPLPAETAWSTA